MTAPGSSSAWGRWWSARRRWAAAHSPSPTAPTLHSVLPAARRPPATQQVPPGAPVPPAHDAPCLPPAGQLPSSFPTPLPASHRAAPPPHPAAALQLPGTAEQRRLLRNKLPQLSFWSRASAKGTDATSLSALPPSDSLAADYRVRLLRMVKAGYGELVAEGQGGMPLHDVHLPPGALTLQCCIEQHTTRTSHHSPPPTPPGSHPPPLAPPPVRS